MSEQGDGLFTFQRDMVSDAMIRASASSLLGSGRIVLDIPAPPELKVTPQPLTDPLALQLLDHFKRQPYEPAHLGALRDRLEEIGREDLLFRLASFDDAWQEYVQRRKRSTCRRSFARWLRKHGQDVNARLLTV